MTQKIIEYHIVRGENPVQLTKNVQLAIADDFEPIGGVSAVISVRGEVLLLQAVVKYEPVATVRLV